MIVRNIIRSLWHSADGSALVEASVLVPVLVILFFGVFEFSWYFYNQQLVEIGVRDAARYLLRGPYYSAAAFPFESNNPCLDATNTAAAQNLAVSGTIDGSGSARVAGWTVGAVTVNCTTFNNSSGSYDGPSTIYLVTVSTSFPDPTFGFLKILGLSTLNLSALNQVRYFGAG